MPKSIQVIPIQDRYTYRDLLDLPPLLKVEEAAEILQRPDQVHPRGA